MAIKKTASKTSKSQVKKAEINDEVSLQDLETNSNPPLLQRKISKKVLIFLVIAGLLLLAFYKKDWFVAATVNNQPITNLELQIRLNKQYKTQLLNQIVNEKIIEQEATKKNIVVSPNDINQKVSQTESQYGGAEAFNALLSQQGLSREEFVKQIKLQLIVEKIYQNEIQPTNEEIQSFMDANASDPEATDAAKFKETATESIRQQKLSNLFQTKFQELKQSAKVQIF